MVKEVVDELFLTPTGMFFDQITLTVTPDNEESENEITIVSDRIRTECLYSSIIDEIN